MKKVLTVKRMSFTAVFAALSVVLYTVVPKIQLPIFPPFLEINFSMIPILICAFMLGPIDATICVVVRFLIKLPFSGTGFVGEAADLLIGLPVAISAGGIYIHTHWKRKELWAFLCSIFLWVSMSLISNAFINIPFYSQFYSGGLEMIVKASSDALKIISFGHIQNVTQENFMFYYLTFSVLPFNLLLSLLVVLVTWPVHKRLRSFYDRLGE